MSEKQNSKSRRVLDIEIKKEIIRLGGKGFTHQKIAAMYGIGRSTVTKILLSKDKILKNDLGSLNGKRYRLRNSNSTNLETLLIQRYFGNFLNQNSIKLDQKDNNSLYDILNSKKAEDILNEAKEIVKSNKFNIEINFDWVNKFKKKLTSKLKRFKKANKSDSNLNSQTGYLEFQLVTPIKEVKSNTTLDTEFFNSLEIPSHPQIPIQPHSHSPFNIPNIQSLTEEQFYNLTQFSPDSLKTPITNDGNLISPIMPLEVGEINPFEFMGYNPMILHNENGMIMNNIITNISNEYYPIPYTYTMGNVERIYHNTDMGYFN